MKKVLLVLVCALLPAGALIGCGDTKPKPEGTGQQQDGTQPECGNGQKETGETCDDGNKTAGDGCSATCTVEEGYECKTAGSACTKKEQKPVEVVCTNNAIVDKEKGELCDMSIAKGQEGYCPRTLADCRELATNVCQKVSLEGSDCTSKCVLGDLETKPIPGDGCCPVGADPSVDTDCIAGKGCTKDLDCGTSGKLSCVLPSGGAKGYCSPNGCSADADCANNGMCARLSQTSSVCLAGCEKDADCVVKGDTTTVRQCMTMEFQGGTTRKLCTVFSAMKTEDYGKACKTKADCGTGSEVVCLAPELGGFCSSETLLDPRGVQCGGEPSKILPISTSNDRDEPSSCLPLCDPNKGNADCGGPGVNRSCVSIGRGAGVCFLNNDGPNPAGAPCKLDADCKGAYSICYKDKAGADEVGLCRPGCAKDTDCGTGELCKGLGKFNQHRNETRENLQDLKKLTGICVKGCENDGECSLKGVVDRPNDSEKTSALKCVDWKDSSTKNGCYLEFKGTKEIGESCEKDTDCAKGGAGQAQCAAVNEKGDKVCTVANCKDDAACATITGQADSVCQPLRVGGENSCLKTCTSDSACSQGTICRVLGGASAHKDKTYCMPAVKETGVQCSSSDDCGDGKLCIKSVAGGYCASLCEKDSQCSKNATCTGKGKLNSRFKDIGYCWKTCKTDNDCNEGITDDLFSCFKNSGEEVGECRRKGIGTAKVGEACSDVADCAGGAAASCVSDGPKQGSWCSLECTQDSECGADGWCRIESGKTKGLCAKKCTSASSCLANQKCEEQASGDAHKSCLQDLSSVSTKYYHTCSVSSDCDPNSYCGNVGENTKVCLQRCGSDVSSLLSDKFCLGNAKCTNDILTDSRTKKGLYFCSPGCKSDSDCAGGLNLVCDTTKNVCVPKPQ